MVREEVMSKLARRHILAGALAAPFLPRPGRAQGVGRVVVVGGGFAGATAARFLRREDPKLEVILVEQSERFVACPFSNLVIAGMREIEEQTFGYDKLKAEGVRLIHAAATGLDLGSKTLRVAGDGALPFDRLILAPGVDVNFAGLPGYDEAASEKMPHAWKAGAQTMLLRRQLEAMPDGGLVVISAPSNPFRCPPGPYERASLIAHYLKTKKPKSKLVVLDAKDAFSKQRLFQAAWARLYPGLLEWVSLSNGGKVGSVDAATMTVKTDFNEYKAAVANVIPPQKAGKIAEIVGAVDRTGWCPIDPVTFESKLLPGVHVIGDATIAGAMPKSAFSANAQAKICASVVANLLNGRAPTEPRLINTCYSLIAPEEGISVAGVYRPQNGVLAEIQGSGGVSPADASDAARAAEAAYAHAWFTTITAETFG
jgi:NADPH-dependent 2,4-dienoyl-CoA reductase/sulfur reductase-like enzyme